MYAEISLVIDIPNFCRLLFQQKAKEAAVGVPDTSLPSTVSDETEGPKMNLPVLNIGFPETAKPKKPSKPKRPPSTNPKKQDKAKAKSQNEGYVSPINA